MLCWFQPHNKANESLYIYNPIILESPSTVPSLPSRMSQNTRLGSLYYIIAASHSLSILHMIDYIYTLLSQLVLSWHSPTVLHVLREQCFYLRLLWQCLWVTAKCSVRHSVMSNSLQLHGLHSARLPCTSPTHRACSNSCPLSQWCHPTISSSAVPVSYYLKSFPKSESFHWVSSSHQIAKVLEFQLQHQSFQWTPRNDFPAQWPTGWISLQSKGLSRVFSNTTVQKHQFFWAQLSL